MSKYYKEEDLQKALIGFTRGTGIDSKPYNPFDYAINVLALLPTIEVSEDAISRGNLISDLAGIWEDGYTPNLPRTMLDFQDMLEDINYKIRNAPSVAPKPKEGQWIDIGLTTHSYKCSVCGRMLVNITDGKKTVAKNYPYCHCGAKMKGAE